MKFRTSSILSHDIGVIFLEMEEMVKGKTYHNPFICTFLMSMINDVAGLAEHYFHLLLIQMCS
jgi:hypothetical protein